MNGFIGDLLLLIVAIIRGLCIGYLVCILLVLLAKIGITPLW